MSLEACTNVWHHFAHSLHCIIILALVIMYTRWHLSIGASNVFFLIFSCFCVESSFGICILMYAGAAVLGYLLFGESTKSQFTLNLPQDLIASKIAVWTTVGHFKVSVKCFAVFSLILNIWTHAKFTYLNHVKHHVRGLIFHILLTNLLCFLLDSLTTVSNLNWFWNLNCS